VSGLLLVEGDLAEAELLVRLLGTDVAVARDAAEAMAALDRQRPRALLVAERLPGMDGLALLQRLRGTPRLTGVPVIMLCSTRDPSLAARAYALGANSVVRKPTTFEELRAALQELAAYWLRRNEPAETAVKTLS
jgi:CheY-like chemotaxis protein